MPKSLSKTPAPKKDRIYGSDKNKVGSASSKASAKGIELNESILATLSQKAKDYNESHPKNKVSVATLKAVMRRGMGAYSTSHRPTITGGAPNSRQAWGFARVNKFLKKKAGQQVKAAYVQDDDLMADGGDVKKFAFIEKWEGGFYWLITKDGDNNYYNVDGDKRLSVVKDMAKRWGYNLVSKKQYEKMLSDSKLADGGETKKSKEAYTIVGVYKSTNDLGREESEDLTKEGLLGYRLRYNKMPKEYYGYVVYDDSDFGRERAKEDYEKYNRGAAAEKERKKARDLENKIKREKQKIIDAQKLEAAKSDDTPKPAYLMTKSEYEDRVIPLLKEYEKFTRKNSEYLANTSYSGLYKTTYEQVLSRALEGKNTGRRFDTDSEEGAIKKWNYIKFSRYADEKMEIPKPTPKDILEKNVSFFKDLNKFFADKVIFDNLDSEYKKSNKPEIRRAIEDDTYKKLLENGEITEDEVIKIAEEHGIKVPKKVFSQESNLKKEAKKQMDEILSKIPKMNQDVFKSLYKQLFEDFKDVEKIVIERETERFEGLIKEYIELSQKEGGVNVEKLQTAIVFWRDIFIESQPRVVKNKDYRGYPIIENFYKDLELKSNYKPIMDKIILDYAESLKYRFLKAVLDNFPRVSKPISDVSRESLKVGKKGFEGRYRFNFADGSYFDFVTEAIPAAGYNIVSFHYRYITHLENATLADGTKIKGYYEIMQNFSSDSMADGGELDYTKNALEFFKKELGIKSDIVLVQSKSSFDPISMSQTHGHATAKKDNKFYVAIDFNETKNRFIRTLAHELVHVKQMEDNRLRFEDNKIIFDDEKMTYNEYQEKYHSDDIPKFEDEAYTLERVLQNKYAEQENSYADGGSVGQEITCVNCGWHWNTSDSDESDKYICHKCGFDNRTFYDPEPIGVMADGGVLGVPSTENLIQLVRKERENKIKEWNRLGYRVVVARNDGYSYEKEYERDTEFIDAKNPSERKVADIIKNNPDVLEIGFNGTIKVGKRVGEELEIADDFSVVLWKKDDSFFKEGLKFEFVQDGGKYINTIVNKKDTITYKDRQDNGKYVYFKQLDVKYNTESESRSKKDILKEEFDNKEAIFIKGNYADGGSLAIPSQHDLIKMELGLELFKPSKTIEQIAKEKDVPLDFAEEQLRKGMKTESEHSDNPIVQETIALQHLDEMIDYYEKLEYMENQNKMAQGGVTEFYKQYQDWYKNGVSDKMTIMVSVPNAFSKMSSEDNHVILDVFEKRDESVDGKEKLKELLELADKNGIDVYLEPIPRHNKIKDEAKKEKITREYLISYYKNFGFELLPNGFMVRKHKNKKMEKGDDEIILKDEDYQFSGKDRKFKVNEPIFFEYSSSGDKTEAILLKKVNDKQVQIKILKKYTPYKSLKISGREKASIETRIGYGLGREEFIKGGVGKEIEEGTIKIVNKDKILPIKDYLPINYFPYSVDFTKYISENYDKKNGLWIEKNNKMEKGGYYKAGGEINPDDKNVKDYFSHGSGNVGGVLVGKRHSEGGIKAVNKSTNQPLEMEGGEVVITRNAVSDDTKREFEGKMMTNREILSKINESGGGVSFADGGDIPESIYTSGKEYKYGGKMMKDHEIVSSCGCKHSMADGGIIKPEKPIEKMTKLEVMNFIHKIEPTKFFYPRDTISARAIAERKYQEYLSKKNMAEGGMVKDANKLEIGDKIKISEGYQGTFIYEVLSGARQGVRPSEIVYQVKIIDSTEPNDYFHIGKVFYKMFTKRLGRFSKVNVLEKGGYMAEGGETDYQTELKNHLFPKVEVEVEVEVEPEMELMPIHEHYITADDLGLSDGMPMLAVGTIVYSSGGNDQWEVVSFSDDGVNLVNKPKSPLQSKMEDKHLTFDELIKYFKDKAISIKNISTERELEPAIALVKNKLPQKSFAVGGFIDGDEDEDAKIMQSQFGKYNFK